MALDKLNLEVFLDLADRASGPLKRVGAGARGLSGEVGQATAALQKMERAQAALGRYRVVLERQRKAGVNLAAARVEQTKLAQEMRKGGDAAKEVEKKFKAATANVQKLAAAQEAAKNKAAQMRAALDKAGVGKLSDQKRLREEIDKTTKALERQRAVDARNTRLAKYGAGTAAFGYAALRVGKVGIGMANDWMDPARRAGDQEERIRAMGLGEAADQAIAQARALDVAGTSVVDNLTLTADALAQFNPQQAGMALPTLARLQAAAQAQGQDGGEASRAALEMLKVVSARGGFKNAEEFQRQADWAQRVQSATGGQVSPQEWLGVLKGGGVAARQQSEQAMYGLAPLVASMGGEAVGKALFKGNQSLHMGTVGSEQARILQRLGLIGDPSRVKFDKVGQVAQLGPGALKGDKLFTTDRAKWMYEVFLPALQQRGITSQRGVLEAIQAVSGKQKDAAEFMAQLYLQRAKIEQTRQRVAGAEGISTAYDRSMGGAAGQELALAKRREDLYNSMGKNLLPLYVKLLEVVNKVVAWIARFAEQHPMLAKAIAVGAAGLAVLVAVLGAVAIGFGALLVKGLLFAKVFGGIGVAAKVAGGSVMWLGGALKGVALWGARLGGGGAVGLLKFAGAVGLMATAIYLWIKNWEGIKGGMAAILEDLGTIDLTGIGIKIAFSLVSGILGFLGLDGAAQWVQDWGDRIIQAWDKFSLYEVGANMVTGLLKGITSKYTELRDRLSMMAGDMVDNIKGKLGISSPSRVFAELGGYISEGLALGMEQRQKLVSSAALALAAATMPVGAAGMAAAGGLARSQAGAPAMQAGSTYNITINAAQGMDPQAIAQAVQRALDERERAQRGRVLSQLSDME